MNPSNVELIASSDVGGGHMFDGLSIPLNPRISFDGTETSAVQINLTIEYDRTGHQVMLDVSHDIIRELVTNKDEQLFDLIENLIAYAEQEGEQVLKQRRQEDERANQNARISLTIKEPKKAPGYIYLIKSGDSYKIGRTKSISSRMKTFGIQLPFPFEIVHMIEAENMYQAEEELHQKYSHCRLNGEWFALSSEDVQAIKAITKL
jgi:hypothetical protein